MALRFGFIVLVLLASGCSTDHSSSKAAQSAVPTTAATASASAPHEISAKRTTVVWISIDGFRHDYMERFHPPALSRLAAEGAFTTHETPIFPSLTFPNHIAQVTGVGVDGHGIPMNSFLDDADGQLYNFPDQSRLLRAEPIWITAERQGVKTACINWPMSDAQTDPNHAAFFDAAFDTQETDEHRLNRIVALLNADTTSEPCRLIMGYMSRVDHVGHQAGPDSPQIAAAVAETDQDVDHFVKAIVKWFNATHTADDELVMIFSTDHGMANVKVLVNLDRLIGADLLGAGTRIVTSGPIATIHFTSAAADRETQILRRLSTYPFLTAWKAADVPAKDHFSDPTRIGQLVVMLKLGYTFTPQRIAATMPALHGVKGMHGYDPAESTDLQGSAVIYRLRRRIGGRDLGPMDNTQWDATVCKLLGIQPPIAADQRAVNIP